MKFPWRCTGLFWAGTMACLTTALSEDGNFKVMGGTASLDGHFAVGYGVNDLTRTPLPDLRESPADDTEFDRRFTAALKAADEGEPVNLKDYLVDLRTHRAVAVLPGFRYFPGRNHQALEVGWSVDGHTALAIYGQRFGTIAVAWIETSPVRVTPMQDKLEKDFQDLLVQDKGKAYTRRRKKYAISFFDPIVTGSGDVIIGWAEANIPKEDEDDFDYALRFHVTKRHRLAHFELVHGRRGGDTDYDQPLDNPKEDMKHAYQRLRSKLRGAARKSLEHEQADWEKLVGEQGGLSNDWRARELELRRDLL